MGLFRNLTGIFTILLILTLSFASSNAIQIKILNTCSYTGWAAANPGGGRQLNQGQTWTLTNVNGRGRIWGRANCAFVRDGRGKCESGDCDGRLECRSNGRAPNTIAEYALDQSNDNDIVGVSVVEGFNIPIGFSNLTGSCTSQESKCTGDVNGACPTELRDPGGCNNPCTVFNNNQFCCTSGNICEATSYSKFFKDLCPYASTYPSDDDGKSICPTGIDYSVVFCPSSSSEDVARSPPSNPSGDSGFLFKILNNCRYTVWAAAIPGGGRKLNHGERWIIDVAPGTTSARIWARTNCSFDDSGIFRCQTGDCSGVLECQGYGQAPNTLAEYTLNGFSNLNFFDISLVDGFNVPMEFSPTSSECSRGIRCTADINGQCPSQLRASDGCNNPCTVFKTDQYCCNSSNCGPTNYSRFFKNRCPNAYSYPKDDQTNLFTCSGWTDYNVVFCPD
ncbi:uncharacterized protein LOC112094677 [Morus notabilis]|uniref:uncharacterized protein LOC112094677 n=1 Tax=Morus notabilis TaxID=981085 RepID=UPI000CED5317|nr:uncharacterized protein LOC112094677 [Morus notabilis]